MYISTHVAFPYILVFHSLLVCMVRIVCIQSGKNIYGGHHGLVVVQELTGTHHSLDFTDTFIDHQHPCIPEQFLQGIERCILVSSTDLESRRYHIKGGVCAIELGTGEIHPTTSDTFCMDRYLLKPVYHIWIDL
jgi:hypothetical protein